MALRSVNLHNIRYIGDRAFKHGGNLSTVMAPNDGIRSIGRDAFLHTEFFNRNPNNDVIYVGNWVIGFRGNIIGNVALRAGTIGIADGAFKNQTALQTITRPNTIRYIGAYAFGGSGLRNISLQNIQYIDEGAFRNAENLTSVTTLNAVRSIGARAFANTAITSFGFTPSVQCLGEAVFENARNLRSVSSMQSMVSITAIPDNFFYNTAQRVLQYQAG